LLVLHSPQEFACGLVVTENFIVGAGLAVLGLLVVEEDGKMWEKMTNWG